MFNRIFHFCLIFFLDDIQTGLWLHIWVGLLGPARGPAHLRSAPRARGAAAGGSPRHAARASSLRFSGPVGPARIPGSLSSTTVAVAVLAPLRKRAAPPPGFYPARGPCLTAPHVGSRGARLGSPVSLPSTTVAAVVFAPPRMRAALPPGPCPARGPRPASSLPGGREGTCPPPCKRHAGPVQTGNGVGLVPVSRCPGCARGATFQRSAVVFAPPRMRAAPPPGPCPARGPRPRHFASRAPRARLASPTPSVDLCVALRARGPAGPAATTPTLGCDHLRGGRVLRPRSPPPA